MEVLKTNQEIVHEGWLIKSPPTKLWRARWRERWFMLRHSGELPGQYFLEYYADKKCRKLKGKIDLDQCEQVDAGLRFENRKQKYQFMFNVKTRKRTYYLVAENEVDMNKWVDAVCQICGLKAQDDEQQCQMFSFDAQESPPISPASTISGPYIPISECISGRSLNDTSSLNSTLDQGLEHYDAPRRLAPSPSRSPITTDAESVFTDDEWTASAPSVNWETFPLPGDGKSCSTSDTELGSWSVCKRFGKLKIVDSSSVPTTAEKIPTPPRPPKPAHMSLESPGHNYLNLDGATESSKPITPGPITPVSTLTDETYDFPRSHQPGLVDGGLINKQIQNRHCYSNAAPTDATGVDDRIFRYDFHNEEPSSPRSENSTTIYSNLSSPVPRFEGSSSSPSNSTSHPQPAGGASTTGPQQSALPPVVYRELKPGRKASDTCSVMSNEPSPGVGPSSSTGGDSNSAEHSEPPSINRKLKPLLNSLGHEKPLQLISTPGAGGRLRAAPSPISLSVHSNMHHLISDEDDNFIDDRGEIRNLANKIPSSSRKLVDLQYLDLDLGTSNSFNASTVSPAQSPLSSTVYKTVDFLKTEAFNRTRQKVEEERKQCTDGLT